jgi:glycosyltransferase involved in cell wall biosynthesis
MPLVSIIIPTYNCSSEIEGCIESILAQTWKNFEIIIQDGGSTDGTIELINSLMQRPDNQIRFSSEKDKGIYDAMNKAMDQAAGSWYHFLGSDDRFYDNNVLESIFSPAVNLDCDLLYGKVLFKQQRIEYGHETNFYQMLKEKFNICHQAIFYSSKAVKTIGKYSLSHPVYADFEYNLRCFKNSQLRKKYIDRLIAVFNEEGTSKNGEQLDSFYSTLLTQFVIEFENPAQLYLDQFRLKQEIQELRESRSFRLGNMLLNPLHKLRGLLKK